jgi:hypothetical protein
VRPIPTAVFFWEKKGAHSAPGMLYA